MAAQVQPSTTTFISFLPLKWLWFRFLLPLLLANVAFSGQVVNYLPGFNGELPFKLETGYISVDNSELFYYFIESQGNPEEDPLLLWLGGGPGCSSFNGLIYEIGPMEFDIDNYTGGLPELKLYPYAWTMTASIIFLDAPVGTGFSYARTPQGWSTSDSKSAEQSYQFLRKWLLEYPHYQLVQLYIGGDGHSGITVPLITQKVIEGNKAKVLPYMNLKGYLLDSPRTDSFIDENSRVEYAYRMALISKKLYGILRDSCNGNYVDVDPFNAECVTSLALYEKCVKDLYINDFLEPNCGFSSGKPNQESVRRSVKENPPVLILSPPRIPELWCRNFNYVLSHVWTNNPDVQVALHVRKGTVLDWVTCNQSLSYTKDVSSVVDVHRYLSTKGLRLLVDSGDRDMVIPFIGTETWIKSLNMTIVDDWRPWFIEGQIAGYTRKYTENGFQLTFTTIKGGGHTAPEYYRKECYEMFRRWIHYYPL